MAGGLAEPKCERLLLRLGCRDRLSAAEAVAVAQHAASSGDAELARGLLRRLWNRPGSFRTCALMFPPVAGDPSSLRTP